MKECIRIDKLKNLHLIPNEKFTEPYIEFVNNNFEPREHLFLVIGKGMDAKIASRNNVQKVNKTFKSLWLVIKGMYKCEKMFLHGLFFNQIVFMLFMQPWLLKKSNWAIWGGDLYWYQDRPRSVKYNLIELVREYVIRNMGGLITQIRGDYDLAKLWYGAKGKYYSSFMYPSNLFHEYDLTKIEKESNTIYIQVGNSADPSNNHLEVFLKLEKYKEANIKIICPLSYGPFEYREKVIKEGNQFFGDKFYPIIDFMPFERYLEILAKIDIAIFGHKRQQAIGNITTLLGLGKKVYIRDDITTWEFCDFHDLEVYSFNEESDGLFEKLNEDVKNRNIDNVKKQFSQRKLKEELFNIFCE